jgi:hypothetical protein
MAEYKGIKGFKVQTVSTDPAASIIATGTWASGGSLNTGRRLASGIGTQTANLFAGGETATAKVGSNESYNGTSWTEVNDLNSGRGSLSSFGIQTAGIVAGGELDPGATSANTESWDGTNWTEVNDLNTARRSLTYSGAGTSNCGFNNRWFSTTNHLFRNYRILEWFSVD